MRFKVNILQIIDENRGMIMNYAFYSFRLSSWNLFLQRVKTEKYIHFVDQRYYLHICLNSLKFSQQTIEYLIASSIDVLSHSRRWSQSSSAKENNDQGNLKFAWTNYSLIASSIFLPYFRRWSKSDLVRNGKKQSRYL